MYAQLDQRPQAPETVINETIQSDEQIITFENHPRSNINVYYKFNPSYVGKTYQEMKQRENNRNINFFKSNELDTNLKMLYGDMMDLSVSESYHCKCNNKCCIVNQKANSLSIIIYVENFTDAHLPPDVQSLITGESIADRRVITRISSYSLPVIPHIQVFQWNPQKHCICDFSGWTTLRVLRIEATNGLGQMQIKLPTGLISFSLKTYCPDIESFEDIFKDDIEHNTNVFQSLKHLQLECVTWNVLPTLSNCSFLDLKWCSNLKTIEAPICKMLKVKRCEQFVGFGPNTIKSNYHLEKVVLDNFNANIHIDTNSLTRIPFEFPPGSPTGYKLIDLYRFQVSSLPLCIDPLAYISILHAGSYLYIRDVQSRNNLAFYFDHMKVASDAFDEGYDDEKYDKLIKKHYPKDDESLISMTNRIYGFNWPKFITKIQRQYRFKKFIKAVHTELSTHLPTSLSKYDIGKLLGATQTFKSFNKDKDKGQSPSFISHITSTTSKRARIC